MRKDVDVPLTCACQSKVFFNIIENMLDNQGQNEASPQKKKRKFSNSQENSSSNQEICYIKVFKLLYNGHSSTVLFFLLPSFFFFFFYYIWEPLLHLCWNNLLLRTWWSPSLHQSARDWKALNLNCRLWTPHVRLLHKSWTAWCLVPRIPSRFLWLLGHPRVPLRLGTKCDGKHHGFAERTLI